MTTLRNIGSMMLYLTLLNWFAVICSTNGAVTISPSPRAAVCRVGDRLEITCNSTGSVVTWKLAIIGATNSISRTLSTTTQSQNAVPIKSTTLIFSRVSELRALPFISMVFVTSVSQGLNGTRVTCTELGTASTMATTSIYIYGSSNAYHPNPPNVDFKEHFEMEGVSIDLSWTQALNESLVSYSISVVPMLNTTISMIGNTGANLSVHYNSPYNVSIVADFCGQRNSTTFIELNYVKCEDPSYQLLDDSLDVLGYTFPALGGNSINFSCPPGLQIIGPNSAICMGNGEWEPDLREVKCKANYGPPTLPISGYILPYASTFEGAEVICIVICDRNESLVHKEAVICTKTGQWEPNISNVCEEASSSDIPGISIKTHSLSQDGKIAVVSSVTVFILVSIVFFITGFLCGHFSRKEKIKTEIVSQPNETQIPYYDDIDQLNIQPTHLEQNIAYGQVL